MARDQHEGSICQRPDGRWGFTFKDANGSWRSGTAPTQVDAAVRMRDLAGQHHDIKRRRTEPRVDELLADWLQHKAKGGLATNAALSYRERLDLLPRWLLELRATTISPLDIQRALDEVASTPRLDGERRAPGTVVQLRGHLVAAWKFGMLMGTVPINAAEPSSVAPTIVEEVVPLDRLETRALLLAVRGHRLESLYMTALTLGLRQGELRGLQWSSVDLAARSMAIEWQRTGAQGARKRPKGSRPNAPRIRHLVMPASLSAALANWRREWVDDQGRLPGPDDLVWPAANTRKRHHQLPVPLGASNLRRHLAQAIARAQIRTDVRFHDLRHTAATHMLAAGWSGRQVMDALGHRSPVMVLRYAHVLEDMKNSAAERLDTYWSAS